MAANHSRAKIIICDDEEDILELASLVLGNGYDLVTTSDASELLGLVEHEKPDIVIVDLRMPGVTGAEFVAELRQHSRAQRLSIIMMSASIELTQVASRYQLDAVIKKPFDISQLRDVVKQVLNRNSKK